MGDETMEIGDAVTRLPELAERASEKGDAFTVLANGKPAAVIVGYDWYDSAQFAMNAMSDEYRSG
jgi:PHD/YefM family antitoxin component YafN of YafNO toxin-antitoxin module